MSKAAKTAAAHSQAEENFSNAIVKIAEKQKKSKKPALARGTHLCSESHLPVKQCRGCQQKNPTLCVKAKCPFTPHPTEPMVILTPCACGSEDRAVKLHWEDYYKHAKALVKARRKQESIALTVLIAHMCMRSLSVVRSVLSKTCGLRPKRNQRSCLNSCCRRPGRLTRPVSIAMTLLALG
jgi:hypothetical protein